MHRVAQIGMYQALHDVLARALLAAGIALLAAVALTPIAKALAVRVGLVDRPGGRKTHGRPTPLIGGLVILLATAPVALFIEPITAQIRGLGVAVALLLAAGILDDLYDLRWRYRLGVQIAAGLALVYIGGVRVEHLGEVFGLGDTSLGALSPLFTVLATVGLINAVNMVDGVDGVAGLAVLASLLMITAAAIWAGNSVLADGLVLLFGAVAAFLVFNLRTPWNKHAQVFLGSGAEVLGLIIAYACFRLTQNPDHPVPPVLAPFLIAPPVVDCLALFVRRIRAGRVPFIADQDHIHHLLAEAGFAPTTTALLIAGASLVIGGCAGLAIKGHIAQPWLLVAYLVMVFGYFVFTGKRERCVGWLGLVQSNFVSAASERRPLAERASAHDTAVAD